MSARRHLSQPILISARHPKYNTQTHQFQLFLDIIELIQVRFNNAVLVRNETNKHSELEIAQCLHLGRELVLNFLHDGSSLLYQHVDDKYLGNLDVRCCSGLMFKVR
jgi:hypothetical protein